MFSSWGPPCRFGLLIMWLIPVLYGCSHVLRCLVFVCEFLLPSLLGRHTPKIFFVKYNYPAWEKFRFIFFHFIFSVNVVLFVLRASSSFVFLITCRAIGWLSMLLVLFLHLLLCFSLLCFSVFVSSTSSFFVHRFVCEDLFWVALSFWLLVLVSATVYVSGNFEFVATATDTHSWERLPSVFFDFHADLSV